MTARTRDALGRRRTKPKPRERGASLVSALRVLRLLCHAEWHPGQLADAAGLTTRTFYRVLRAVEDAGVPVVHRRDGQEVRLSARRADVVRALAGPETPVQGTPTANRRKATGPA